MANEHIAMYREHASMNAGAKKAGRNERRIHP
jgi:hypothetical protein